MSRVDPATAAALNKIDVRVAEIDAALKRLDADDYKHFKDLHRAGANEKVRQQLNAERAVQMHNRARVLAGEPVEQPAPTEQAKALRLPPVELYGKAERPCRIEPAITRRDDLVGVGDRTADEILDVAEVEERVSADIAQAIEVAHAKMREAMTRNPTYAFDLSTLIMLKTTIIQAMAQATIIEAVGGVLRRELEVKLTDRIAVLEKRIEEFERGGFEYRGIYQRAQAYRRGQVVTHDGSMWVAAKDTVLPPGAPEGMNEWTLAVKRGRDGKDATR
jgi:hypothetical protein